MYKKDDIVITPDGRGFIADEIEYYNRLNGGQYRYAVNLDINPYFYTPYYFDDELYPYNI